MEKSLSVPGGMKSLSINFVNRQPLPWRFRLAFDRGGAGVANPIAVVSNEYTECYGLAIADSTKDENLSKVEYVYLCQRDFGWYLGRPGYLELPLQDFNFEVFASRD
jgi:hypothetical protein